MANPLGVKKVFVIGSGPIVIGQGCEFDYSGTQAIRALKQEGLEVVLLNSNPATIMTDPELADATYIEPITPASCRAILEKEGVDAILPTLGGQTALNMAFELDASGVLEREGVRLLGVGVDAIRKAEDRKCFKRLVVEAGFDTPRSLVVESVDEALKVLDELSLPLIIRPSFTLGGGGSGMAKDAAEFVRIVENGLARSPSHQVLIEESVEGWKEFELEVMRDRLGNHVVVCSIENVDPMGTHTGDSITVAPVQTLRDRQYQRMRDAAFAVMDAVGIWGGANVQFAVEKDSGRMVVIEMNPRVSRSSALASKATGYPIAKIAARLALGYTLDELPNDIVGTIPSALEPSLDYCVVKIPRWNFEKFRSSDRELSSQMKSIGEVMALGRNFNEALQKALRSAEAGWRGLDDRGPATALPSAGTLWRNGEDAGGDAAGMQNAPLEMLLSRPNPERLFAVKEAFRRGFDVRSVHGLTRIDEWFLENIKSLVEMEKDLREKGPDDALLREAKRNGFGDAQIAATWGVQEAEISRMREESGVKPVVKMVDTCAGEFEAATPYFYLSYDDECECRAAAGRKVVVLGSGPNRIGQGIEFDYCCVHASLSLREAGVETIMINCNPETVSTDFDVSDRLYFEPVNFEHVAAVVAKEDPEGVIVQFGGQTPLKLIHRLRAAGVGILGTQVDAVDRAEDRSRCSELLDELGIKHPTCGFASTREEALAEALAMGFPVLLRPPYVLGGMAMSIAFSEEEFLEEVDQALEKSEGRMLMIDKFVDGAVEIDVDAVSDGRRVAVAGCMEHIEEAGVHSGDSSCVFPPVSLDDETVEALEEATRRIALELGVVGMLNVQFAVRDDDVYCLEVNPRASRTVPFISKATGIPWVKIATRVMLGEDLPAGLEGGRSSRFFSVKTPVLPFDRFPGVDPVLGPEMYSTGEVMGIGASFGEAFLKAQQASGFNVSDRGTVFVSVANRYKRQAVFPAKTLSDLGFSLLATAGTAKVLRSYGIPAEVVPKMTASEPGIVKRIERGEIAFVVNTPVGKKSMGDERLIRLAASTMKVPCVTTMAGFHALAFGLASMRGRKFEIESLQARALEFSTPGGRPALSAKV